MNNVLEKDTINAGYAKLLLYIKKYNGYDIDEDYECSDGFPLGEWVKQIRELKQSDMLNEKQVEKLERIGFCFDKGQQNWELMYFRLKMYFEKQGKLPEGIHCQNQDGVMLGAWMDKQKRFACYLSRLQQEKLCSLGVNLEE